MRGRDFSLPFFFHIRCPLSSTRRYAMTNEQKQAICSMRESGVAIPAISAQLGLSINTIKSFCKRHGIYSSNQSHKNILFCLQCHTKISQPPHRKAKKFCSNKCRQLWWAENTALIPRDSQIERICPVCKTPFLSYKSKNRIYCSRTCYGKSKEVYHDHK